MKINYIKGDLFQTSCDIIAHGCNMQGVMGSGVAAIVKRMYPEAYKEYHKLYENNKLELGLVNFVDIVKTQKRIIIANCITQEHYGKDSNRYADYTAIRKCMWVLNEVAKKNLWTLAMPMIGSGLGGGNWDIIEEIIEEEIKDVVPNVYVL